MSEPGGPRPRGAMAPSGEAAMGPSGEAGRPVGLAAEPPLCDDRLIWDVRLSYWHLPALTVADELGLFQRLAAGPAPGAALAGDLGLGERGAEALLALLAALGFLVRQGGQFALTEAARSYLLPGTPFYYGPLLWSARETDGHRALRAALLRDAGRSQSGPAGHGASAVDAVVLRSWAAGGIDAARARRLTAVMHSHSFPAAFGVARRGEFAGVRRLLDVGGGSGCYCLALALRYPELRCTVLELPAVGDAAGAYLAAYGLEDRIAIHRADMFAAPWPEGHDAVFFSNVFHDWGGERCRFLARRAFEVLPPGGRVYVHEMLLADGRDGPPAAAAFSVHMLVNTQGKQLTAGELTTLLVDAGFREVTVTPTYGYYSLVAATKPPAAAAAG